MSNPENGAEREKIDTALSEIARNLTLTETPLWIIVSSAALYVHGLDLFPNDIDIAVDESLYEDSRNALAAFATEEDGSYCIDGVAVTLFISSTIESERVEFWIVNEDYIPVNPLETELTYCLERTDKNMGDRIRLIREELVLRETNPERLRRRR